MFRATIERHDENVVSTVMGEFDSTEECVSFVEYRALNDFKFCMSQEEREHFRLTFVFTANIGGGFGGWLIANISELTPMGELRLDLTPDPKNPIYLYVAVCTNYESLVGTDDNRKAGLPCAQTGHAANQMVYQVRQKNNSALNDLLTEWENETGMGFGTEIVVGGHVSKVKQAVEMASLLGYHAAMTKDPEYPLRDGKSMHFIPLETCGYIFGRKNDLQSIMSQFDLLP